MYAVEMKDIIKRFGSFTANNGITLLVKKGEIHCLLGENGAGKSTLMNILFGLYRQDSGEIRINGKPVENHSPLAASRMGLGMVHQHFMLVDALSVWENVVVGLEPGGFRIDRKESIREVQELSDRYHFELNAEEQVGNLSVGMKQRVEILKTVYRGAEIIIMDEPTAVLSPPEVEQFLMILRDMRADGKTIIFITHKLKETLAVADRITVLRAGKSVSTIEAGNASARELAGMMVGHEVDLEIERPFNEAGGAVLSVEGLRLLPNAASTVSFDIREGEIFGIAGVEGNGQKQLEEMIMGLIKCREGRISVLGKDVTKLGTRKRRQLGIGYIPSDRLNRALLSSFSLEDNYLLGKQFSDNYVRHGIVRHKAVKEAAGTLMREYDVRAAGMDQAAGSLSGGNQQKLVVGREASDEPKLIIACQPVRGLDIGAIHYIHEILLKLRKEGKAILLISAELTDIQQLSDRIAVLYKGEILAARKNEDFTEEEIGLLIAGHREAV